MPAGERRAIATLCASSSHSELRGHSQSTTPTIVPTRATPAGHRCDAGATGSGDGAGSPATIAVPARWSEALGAPGTAPPGERAVAAIGTHLPRTRRSASPGSRARAEDVTGEARCVGWSRIWVVGGGVGVVVVGG